MRSWCCESNDAQRKQNKDLNLLLRLVEDCRVARDDTVSVSVEFCHSLSMPGAVEISRASDTVGTRTHDKNFLANVTYVKTVAYFDSNLKPRLSLSSASAKNLC